VQARLERVGYAAADKGLFDRARERRVVLGQRPDVAGFSRGDRTPSR
jgi:hypothetical protein